MTGDETSLLDVTDRVVVVTINRPEVHNPADLPSRAVTEPVEAGHLGRKSGRGFYTYDTPGA